MISQLSSGKRMLHVDTLTCGSQDPSGRSAPLVHGRSCLVVQEGPVQPAHIEHTALCHMSTPPFVMPILPYQRARDKQCCHVTHVQYRLPHADAVSKLLLPCKVEHRQGSCTAQRLGCSCPTRSSPWRRLCCPRALLPQNTHAPLHHAVRSLRTRRMPSHIMLPAHLLGSRRAQCHSCSSPPRCSPWRRPCCPVALA